MEKIPLTAMKHNLAGNLVGSFGPETFTGDSKLNLKLHNFHRKPQFSLDYSNQEEMRLTDVKLHFGR